MKRFFCIKKDQDFLKTKPDEAEAQFVRTGTNFLDVSVLLNFAKHIQQSSQKKEP